MAKVIFYSVLKSLNTMTEIAAVDYHNSPVVSTKLVKFLTLNISIETVDKLGILTGELSSQVKDMTQDLRNNIKSVQSVGNKQDKLMKTVEGLRQRIVELEK